MVQVWDKLPLLPEYVLPSVALTPDVVDSLGLSVVDSLGLSVLVVDGDPVLVTVDPVDPP